MGDDPVNLSMEQTLPSGKFCSGMAQLLGMSGTNMNTLKNSDATSFTRFEGGKSELGVHRSQPGLGPYARNT